MVTSNIGRPVCFVPVQTEHQNPRNSSSASQGTHADKETVASETERAINEKTTQSNLPTNRNGWLYVSKWRLRPAREYPEMNTAANSLHLEVVFILRFTGYF